MTGGDQRNIVDTLHQMELRVSERLVRVETELREWRKDSELLRQADKELTVAVNELRSEFEIERQVCRDRNNRLLIGLAMVAIIALGDLAARGVPLL